MSVIRISCPETAKRGEVIELKAMIQHKMESGHRRDSHGRAIPQDIIKFFECTYNRETIFKSELFPGVSANPFFTFHTRATESGELMFRWTDQHGNTFEQSATLTIT